jgi:ferredoxin
MAQPLNSAPNDAAAARLPGRFVPWANRSAVSIDRSACLRLRTHLASCQACATVCPVQAIEVGPQQLELSGPCTACGRCQTVCPTGALAVGGFDVVAASTSHGTVTVDCHRAPTSPGQALRVPCLGGLSDAQLLTLCANAGDARVVLVDRGWCGRCESGGAEHPAQATLQRVNEWLTEAGVPASRLPRIEAAASLQRPKSDPMQQQGRARRGFFAALARPAGEPPRSECAPARSQASSRREQTLDALQQVVDRHGGRLPQALFHRLDVSAACQGHRVCASACPTGALARWRDDGAQRMGIAFDGASCIGCGHCAALCPEQALQLHAGRGNSGQGRRPLTGFAQRECPGCGSRFAAKDDATQTHCERCRKSIHLARSAFQTLFGARPKTPGTGVFFKEEL